MALLTQEQIRAALSGYKLTVVARETGLSYITVHNVITNGSTPTVKNLTLLSDFVEKLKNRYNNIK